MYYIAYGSNLNFKLMNSRCPRAKPIFYLNELRVNKLFGWRLSFNRYANIIKIIMVLFQLVYGKLQSIVKKN